jgi:chromosome segregation ATPase
MKKFIVTTVLAFMLLTITVLSILCYQVISLKRELKELSKQVYVSTDVSDTNEMVDDSDTYLNRLRENLEAAINSANPMSAEALSAKMAELQRELINRTERRENYDDITEEILRLRELQEQKGMDDATQKEHTKRIKELQKFIQSQPSEITEFDEALVKKLLEKVTVHDDYLEFRFKSGVTISIEK